MSEQRRCDIPCDDDCEAGCHQLHLPRHKRHPSACHCGYQQRVADAAMQAWNERALLCEHTQRVPIGELVDAVLAVPNPELERLRTLLAEKSAEVDDKSEVGHAVADAWMARAEQAEAALARVRADCEEQTSKPITTDVERGIWAQARRTLNTLDAIPKEQQ